MLSSREGTSIYLDKAVWPLNVDEANLFGHYTQKLAKWVIYLHHF